MNRIEKKLERKICENSRKKFLEINLKKKRKEENSRK